VSQYLKQFVECHSSLLKIPVVNWKRCIDGVATYRNATEGRPALRHWKSLEAA